MVSFAVKFIALCEAPTQYVATLIKSTHLSIFLNLFNNNLQMDGLW